MDDSDDLPGSFKLKFLGVREKIFCRRNRYEEQYIRGLVTCINDPPNQTEDPSEMIFEYQKKLLQALLNGNYLKKYFGVPGEDGYYKDGYAFIKISKKFEGITGYDDKNNIITSTRNIYSRGNCINENDQKEELQNAASEIVNSLKIYFSRKNHDSTADPTHTITGETIFNTKKPFLHEHGETIFKTALGLLLVFIAYNEMSQNWMTGGADLGGLIRIQEPIQELNKEDISIGKNALTEMYNIKSAEKLNEGGPIQERIQERIQKLIRELNKEDISIGENTFIKLNKIESADGLRQFILDLINEKIDLNKGGTRKKKRKSKLKIQRSKQRKNRSQRKKQINNIYNGTIHRRHKN